MKAPHSPTNRPGDIKPACVTLRLVLALTALLAGVAASAQETELSAEQPGASSREYVGFQLIAERNIFDSGRSSPSARPRVETRKPVSADTLTLVGAMTYAKGAYAFFDGSGPEFQKVVKAGNTIGDFKVTLIRGSGVKLECGAKCVDLRVGMQMRREENGDWEVASPSAPPLAALAIASDAPGEESDIIKRLMQQREQELK